MWLLFCGTVAPGYGAFYPHPFPNDAPTLWGKHPIRRTTMRPCCTTPAARTAARLTILCMARQRTPHLPKSSAAFYNSTTTFLNSCRAFRDHSRGCPNCTTENPDHSTAFRKSGRDFRNSSRDFLNSTTENPDHRTAFLNSFPGFRNSSRDFPNSRTGMLGHRTAFPNSGRDFWNSSRDVRIPYYPPLCVRCAVHLRHAAQ